MVPNNENSTYRVLYVSFPTVPVTLHPENCVRIEAVFGKCTDVQKSTLRASPAATRPQMPGSIFDVMEISLEFV